MFYVFTLLPFSLSLSLSFVIRKKPHYFLMMMILLLVLITGIGYLMYIKNHRYLSFGLGCLFFLWYWWTASESIFTLTHTPFIIISSSKVSDQQSQDVSIWPIHIIANHTQISVADLPLLLSNKNGITASTCLGKQNAPIW